MIFMISCSNNNITGNTIYDENFDCVKGDINNDLVIDHEDKILLSAFLSGDLEFNERQYFCSDINSDKIIDVEDKALISIINN